LHPTQEAAEGWSPETVAEALDLTATVSVDGWEFRLRQGLRRPLRDIGPAAGILNQQPRWEHGGARNLCEHIGRLLCSPAPSGWATVHPVLHMLYCAFYPL